jgi:hypothetical protein
MAADAATVWAANCRAGNHHLAFHVRYGVDVT